MHPLDGFKAKLARAGKLRNEMRTYMTDFLGSNPIEIIRTFDHDHAAIRYSPSLKREVPILLPVVAGEILGHIRSALDHLVWQLALLTTKTPNKRTQFPVCTTLQNFEQQMHAGVLGDLPQKAQDFIAALQPFHDLDPKKNTLHTLNRFANVDKHRVLNVAAAMPTASAIQGHGFDGMRYEIELGRLVDGKEFARILLPLGPPPSPEIEAIINPVLLFNICTYLDEDPVIHDLDALVHAAGLRVQTIGDDAAHFF